MTTARRPPGPPEEDAPPFEIRPKLPAAQEDADLARVEGQTAHFIGTNENEQKRVTAAVQALDDLIEKQWANLDELRGFKRRVVNLILYRTVKRQVIENTRNRRAMKEAISKREFELGSAKAALVTIRDRRKVLAKEMVRGIVLEFRRKS